jgi:hypothetical protein
MKAISLWQPWASLWCSPRKVHETRHWPLRHRGWLAVHAAKRMEHDMLLAPLCTEQFGRAWLDSLPRGALVGAVLIEGCYRTEEVVRCYGGWKPARPEYRDDLACGNFAAGRFGWKRGAFRLLPEPVPWRGQQGLFDVPDEVLSRILEGAA